MAKGSNWPNSNLYKGHREEKLMNDFMRCMENLKKGSQSEVYHLNKHDAMKD